MDKKLAHNQFDLLLTERLVLTLLLAFGFAFSSHAPANQFTVAEGGTYSGSVSKGTALFAMSNGPLIGTLVFNADGNFTYTAHRQPTIGFISSDSFTYRSSDQEPSDAPWTVSILITPVNDAPIAVPKSFQALVGEPYSGQVEASDIDGDALTFALISGPVNGTLVFNANGSFTYTASSVGDGTDSFTFIANDALADSNIATVSIEIIGDLIFFDRFEDRSFSDCPVCPRMVAIPPGSFVQGAPDDEPQSQTSERPQRSVNVAAFAIGQTTVTFLEWDACLADGGCLHNPSDNGWGRENRPEINVSWNDAQEYVAWLSNKTGHEYRLPSESEWEYATRAGTTGRFNTGECITTDQANFRGNNPATGCPAGIARSQSLPVRSFTPNSFGLHDTHGNVFEWSQDCWNENYTSAPVDGSAWMSGDCDAGVRRGGSWGHGGNWARSAARGWGIREDTRFPDTGFRVVRTVDL